MKNLFKKFNKKEKKSSSGFTIIEVLVALAIFSLSVIGMLVTLSSGIVNTDIVKKKITATYLAQEGVEAVRNIRDDYMIFTQTNGTNGWADFTTMVNTNCNTSGCGIDYGYFPNDPLNGLKACSNIMYCELFIHTIGGGYGTQFTGDISSGFTRVITTTNPNANEIVVTSTVTWTQGGQLRTVSFDEYLFNWYPSI